MRHRLRYVIAALFVIILGVASRNLPLGHPLWDKYLGDALYAVLIYLVLRLIQPIQKREAHLIHAGLAATLSALIECFQLTGIPLAMRENGNTFEHLLSIALGTQFSWWDMLAYAVGIAGALLLDRT